MICVGEILIELMEPDHAKISIMEKPRIIFMGSSDFAIPILSELAKHYPLVGIVTQPDRPAGRGRMMTPPSVKILAESLDIPFIQPENVKDVQAFKQLEAWQPDLIVVAAFGQILRQNVLELPPFGCINVHASLLPRWRGAAPVQAAILHGDKISGVTIMKMDTGVDTGPILAQRAVEILPEDTGGSLMGRLAQEGASLLIETLPAYLAGLLIPQPQSEDGATYAKMLKKEDGMLDFSKDAETLARQVRAFHPWRSTFFFWQDVPLKVIRTHASPSDRVIVGEHKVINGFPAVGTGEGYLVLDEVQSAGKRPMRGDVFLHGARQW